MKNSVNYKTNWSQLCSNNLQTLICLPNESQTIFSILKSASQTTIYYSNESLNNLSFKRVTNYNLIIFYYLNKSICRAFCCSNKSQITVFSFKCVTNCIWVFDYVYHFICRRVHATGVQGKWERTFLSLSQEMLQENCQFNSQQLQSCKYASGRDITVFLHSEWQIFLDHHTVGTANNPGIILYTSYEIPAIKWRHLRVLLTLLQE